MDEPRLVLPGSRHFFSVSLDSGDEAEVFDFAAYALPEAAAAQLLGAFGDVFGVAARSRQASTAFAGLFSGCFSFALQELAITRSPVPSFVVFKGLGILGRAWSFSLVVK